MLTPLLRSLRPHQWVKNAFVLAPAVFALRLTEGSVLGAALLAFAAFCCASSAVYLVNDVRDREEDRRHPLKRRRPVASGEVKVATALTAAGLLVAAAGALALALPGLFALVLAAYLALNLGYSLGLKNIVILDVMVISMGFVLRVLGGAQAVEVEVSRWLLLCTIFLALFLAFSKRRHELTLLAGAASEQRRVLDHYSPAFLDQMINVVTASTVLGYALYVVDPETVEKFGTTALVYTVPFVLFGVFRYLYLIYQKPQDRSPTEALLGDRAFLINFGLWALAVLAILYLDR